MPDSSHGNVSLGALLPAAQEVCREAQPKTAHDTIRIVDMVAREPVHA